MRLTLRTLLAYLDDTLDPAAAKEIGQKLAETPAAQELVSRIREVTRRRRLSAPPVVGDDVDPNTLAEYLDNLLNSEAVAQLEGICLESEIHLAEASACHQILTLIGQPAHISDATRQRMYDLVHAIESIPSDRRLAARASHQQIAVPTMFSQRPLVARVLSVALVLVGVVGVGFLIWASVRTPAGQGKGPGDKEVASTKPRGEMAEHFIPTELPVGKDSTLPPPILDVDVAKEPGSGAAPSSAIKEESVPSNESPPATTDAPEKTPPASDPSKSETPKDEVSKSRPGTATEPPKEYAKVPPKPEIPAAVEPAGVGTYASTSGVLLRLAEKGREWRRLSAQSEIKVNESVICLPLHRALVQLEKGPSVELVGETELVFLRAEEGTDVHVRLDRGRIVLGANAATASFQIDFLDQSWRISLKGPESVVGMGLAAPWKPGGPFPYEATVVVPRGEVEFQAALATHTLGGPVQLRWNSVDGLRDKESLGVPPAWLEREEMTPPQIRAAASLEGSIPYDAPVGLVFIEATGNERRETRILGVQCLGAIGRLPALIDVMSTLEKRDVRQEAVRVLRQSMARGERQEEAMHQALNAKFRDGADGLLGLLRGFSDTEMKQKEVYDALIKLLSPGRELAIRELAIMNLEELAGKPANVNYSPEKPKEHDISGWSRALEDGRLPPKVRGKM